MSDVDSILDSLMDDATGVSFVVVPDGTSASSSSPSSSSTASRVVGVPVPKSGVQGTGSGGKVYSVVRVNGFDRSICFVIVGKGGGAFCIKRNCGFSSHGEAKISFQGQMETCYFICRGGEGSTIIYSQPSIDERRVPDSVKTEWESKQRTLIEWRLAFRAVENADDVGATVDEIKKEISFLNDTSNFRTPAKKRKEVSTREEEASLGNLDFIGHVRTLPEDLSKELDDVISNTMAKGLLTRIVSRLESSVVSQGAALEAVAERAYKRFLVNERDLRAVSGAVQNVQISVGQPIELDRKFDAPTLWSATSFVAEEVVKVAGGLKGVEDSIIPLQADLKSVAQECSNMTKSGPSAKMMKVLVMMSGRMKEASNEIIGLKTKVQDLEAELANSRIRGASTPLKMTAVPDEMDELMGMFDSSYVETKIGGIKATVSPDKNVGTTTTMLETRLLELTQELKSVTADVALLKAGTEDKSVKFAGLGWRSILDCQEWIKVNFPSNRYGLIMDPLLMLDRVFGSDDVEADSQFKTLESRVKLRIATGAEAAAIKALYFKRPRLFHKGQVSMSTDRNKSKLNKLTDHKVWKTGGEGVHNFIVERMNLLHLTISQDIGYVLGSDPKCQLLATMCLNATITFVTQMLAFVDTIYDKLVMASKFTAEQGWSLTMKILDRICEDLFAPKEGVVVAMNVEDPGSICAHVLWSCFRTHDIMTSYLEVNFENHPAISAEYVKFLATNSGFDKVERLETTVSSLKVLVDKATTESTKARSIADGAASAATTGTRALADVSKRVTKLEGK